MLDIITLFLAFQGFVFIFDIRNVLNYFKIN